MAAVGAQSSVLEPIERHPADTCRAVVSREDTQAAASTEQLMQNASQLIAATDRSKGSHGGISAFIVDMKSPGVKLLRAQELVIDDRPWEIAFDNVKVPVEDRIGEEGEGFAHAQHWLNVGRIRHGARSIGVIERCLELGTKYAKERVTFGKPLRLGRLPIWLDDTLRFYGDRILPLTTSIARRWGRISAHVGNKNLDLALAATALEHGLTMATRNVAHYERAGVAIVNPFEARSRKR